MPFFILDYNRAVAGKCGAIEAIVGVMKAHPDNANVFEKGCWVLQSISTNGKTLSPIEFA